MTAIVIYSPLPFIPKFPSKEPYVVVKLGSTFKTEFQLGEEFKIDGDVLVVVIGFYKDGILALPQNSSIYAKLQKEFFQTNSIEHYRELNQDEYNNLYPDELKSLPEEAYPYALRVIPELRSFPPRAYFI
jgi:hypothetical protein